MFFCCFWTLRHLYKYIKQNIYRWFQRTLFKIHLMKKKRAWNVCMTYLSTYNITILAKCTCTWNIISSIGIIHYILLILWNIPTLSITTIIISCLNHNCWILNKLNYYLLFKYNLLWLKWKSRFLISDKYNIRVLYIPSTYLKIIAKIWMVVHQQKISRYISI